MDYLKRFFVNVVLLCLYLPNKNSRALKSQQLQKTFFCARMFMKSFFPEAVTQVTYAQRW